MSHTIHDREMCRAKMVVAMQVCAPGMGLVLLGHANSPPTSNQALGVAGISWHTMILNYIWIDHQSSMQHKRNVVKMIGSLKKKKIKHQHNIYKSYTHTHEHIDEVKACNRGVNYHFRVCSISRASSERPMSISTSTRVAHSTGMPLPWVHR